MLSCIQRSPTADLTGIVLVAVPGGELLHVIRDRFAPRTVRHDVHRGIDQAPGLVDNRKDRVMPGDLGAARLVEGLQVVDLLGAEDVAARGIGVDKGCLIIGQHFLRYKASNSRASSTAPKSCRQHRSDLSS